MDNVIVIVQARVSSKRLPNKVLKLINDTPMLELQIERIKKAKNVDNIVVATSDHPSDSAIETLCKKINTPCFQGNLSNVLDRYYQASSTFPSKHIVRITGDCPLIDASIIDQVISLHLSSKADYTSNCQIPCLPDGLDVEIFTHNTLVKCHSLAKKPSEKEHVTLFIKNNPKLFTIQNFTYSENLSHLRWTVDEPEDFTFVSKVYHNLYFENPNFSMKEVLELLKKKPALLKINNHLIRNQGLERSLQQDKELGFE